MIQQIDDLRGRIEAACIGALAGEAAAGTSAGAADLLGVAESAAACGGYVESDLRQRGLERPSRSGSAGLLLRALPFGMITPLQRPRLRRDAYRCVALAGADEGTAVAAVAAALLVADVMRFDLETSLIRVRQSLLEDAPLSLLDRLQITPPHAAEGGHDADAGAVLQAAIAAVAGTDSIDAAVAAAAGGPAVALSLAGSLAGAHRGAAAAAGIHREQLPHGDRALQIAHRLADHAETLTSAVAASAANQR